MLYLEAQPFRRAITLASSRQNQTIRFRIFQFLCVFQRPGFAHGQPDSSCDLRGAIVKKMPDENKRRNILQVV